MRGCGGFVPRKTCAGRDISKTFNVLSSTCLPSGQRNTITLSVPLRFLNVHWMGYWHSGIRVIRRRRCRPLRPPLCPPPGALPSSFSPTADEKHVVPVNDGHGGATIILSLVVLSRGIQPTAARAGPRVPNSALGVGGRVHEIEVVGAELLFKLVSPELERLAGLSLQAFQA